MARLVQGAFGGLLLPQGFGILGSVFPREHIGKAFSAFGPVRGCRLSAVRCWPPAIDASSGWAGGLYS